MRRHHWARLGLVFALWASVACDDGKTSVPSYVGEEKTLKLAAGEAGVFSVGAAELDVPEGALSEETELSVSVKARSGQPEAKNIAIDVYDYGPDGTRFEKPVKLSFDMQGVAVPKDKKVMVAYLEGSKWTTLSTTVKEGKASAETMHFTPFTLIFVQTDDGTGTQTGGQCGDDFRACGGDLVGTWEYTAACVTSSASPFGEDATAMCEQKPVATVTIDLQGTATFGRDGSFTSEQMVTFIGAYRLTLQCLAQVGTSMGAPNLTCAQVNGMLEGESCVLGNASMPEVSEQSTTGTYAIEGTSVIINDSESGPDDEPSTSPYCVRGDSLTVRIVDNEDGSVVIYSAKRVSSSAAR